MSAGPADVLIPRETANDDTVIVVGYHYDDGARVEAGSALVDVETSKTTVTIDAPRSGYVQRLHEVGEMARIGSAIVRIFDSAEEAFATKPDAVKLHASTGAPQMSAAVRAEIQRRNLDPKRFEGRGFIRMRDLDAPPGAFRAASPSKRFEVSYLTTVAREAVPSTLFSTAKTDRALSRFRERKSLLPVSILPVVILAASKLLKKFPLLNAAYRDGGAFIYDEAVIGLAIDLGSGLRVVSIPQAALAGIDYVETALMQIALDYGNNRLKPHELSGSTFTITDLSAEGVTAFVPVLNRDQSAILGIGTSTEKDRCTLALTFDHRVTEGRTGAIFLKELVLAVESF